MQEAFFSPDPTEFDSLSCFYTRSRSKTDTSKSEGCVMRFVAAMVTALRFTSAFKLATFCTDYPVDCFDMHALAQSLFICPLLIFRAGSWK